MDRQRPRGRDKNVTGQGTGLHRRGSGLGTGPVGSKDGYSGKGRGSGGGSGRRVTRGAGLSLPVILFAVIFYFLNGGSLFGGGSGGTSAPSVYEYGSAGESSGGSFGGLFGEGGTGLSGNAGSAGASNGSGASQGSALAGAGKDTLDETVSSEAKEKRTKILGDGKDVVTIMVYLCGTDLESRSKMATSDLMEMSSAQISDKVNLIVYTGGCTRWNNNIVSSRTNQIYQIKTENGKTGLVTLNDNVGALPMTDPATLTSFIKYCAKHFPANRNELILWDHGSGSVAGYGYDEKFKNTGSMSLSGLNKALKNAGVTFDFVGFDACLMATLENALMLDDYADYLIASEETEPGIGWQYTGWLNALSRNTSMPTTQLGQRIIDDFVNTCAKRTPGQGTTLSLVDLSELTATVPGKLSAFSKSLTKALEEKEYKTISNARDRTLEFARSSQIDQVDLAHLARNVGNKEGKALAEVLDGAVKYRYGSSGMKNAYGLSIYFPFRNARYVDKAAQEYDAIGMDGDYKQAIRSFARMNASGQAAAGGSSWASPIPSLFGTLSGQGSYGSGSLGSGSNGSSYGGGSGSDSNGSSYGGGSGSGSLGSGSSGGSSYGSGGGSYSSSPYGSYSGTSPYGTQGASDELIGQLLGSFLGGDFSSLSGLGAGNTDFLFDRSIPDEDVVQYITDNHLDASALYWTQGPDGRPVLSMTEDQWGLVQSLDLNLFYDDGEGFIDLGLDNSYSFDEDGNLVADDGNTWLAINGQIVAYYHLYTAEDEDGWTITGRIPALLNGERVNLIAVFDSETPTGYIAGAQLVYDEDNEDALPLVAKNLTEIEDGDTLDFLCDFYTYEGEYRDSYLLGGQMTVSGGLKISDVTLPAGSVRLTYRLTDIYNQAYWTETIDR